MPIFEYLCKECNKRYEIFHKSKEIKDEIICPWCGSKNSVKLFSTPMFNIGKTEFNSSCDSCSDNSSLNGGCSSGICGID